ncbi:DEAD/DEAH box helicase [Paenibacillus silvae]|uniref:DEAD/DEAH box helicase n=1 Tax=Paenibacillus silvae TaxID=1325358 RepID=UPI002004918D|nr:DEAD/DEAH box helicase [Paenibacillus silvae]MCK6076768.1 DEAD/DEAH box helicase [Paenibacillus silvae]MCK6151194.1 DEAD/DEAH box helicase [Paenibacillus silvae]MCK6269454.1 DEAD/DEAH box helicase [Paenibacillus silvae]
MIKPHFKDYGLSDEIVRALDSLGYEQPTEVQTQVIPVALEKQDLVVKSQTGSGKTAAYGIPICELVDWNENKPQALILTPTRELALQVNEDITNIGRFKRIKATALYGQSPFHIQKAELKQRTHVAVGTPGRVLDHIERGTLPLERIAYLVIDEADEMLNMGFIETVQAIIHALPQDRTTMLFSATFPEDVAKLSRQYMNTPVEIEIKASGLTTATIEHAVIHTSEVNKTAMLQDLFIMENPDSCIVFCRTQENVDKLFRVMADLDYPVDRIHGGMEQDERIEVMNAFRRGQFRYLVATDVAARGIDIMNITHVINYDIPLEKESYVHRTGRTGRAGQTGRAFTLVTPKDSRRLAEIEAYIGFEIPVVKAASEEEVDRHREAFEQRLRIVPERKKDKREQLNQQIMKLNFNGGKKKKLRAVDFVGTIAKIEGVSADDIGIITILDNVTDVEILNGKGPLVLEVMQHTTIKRMQLKVRKGRK